MSFNEDGSTSFLIVDHEIAQNTDLVIYVLDVWQGDREDPAVGVARYMGVFKGEDLTTDDGEALDPDFSKWKPGYYNEKKIIPQPLFWETLEEIKKGDRDAENFKRQTEGLLLKDDYSFGSRHVERTLYQGFVEAIDILAVDGENEEAWAAVNKYREHKALEYER
jgi:hypothetical protein